MSANMLPIIVVIVVLIGLSILIGWQLAFLWRDPEGYVNWVRRHAIANKNFDATLYRRMSWVGLPIALIVMVAMIIGFSVLLIRGLN